MNNLEEQVGVSDVSFVKHEGQLQDIAVTLAWMADYQAEYGFDGWYFDNANTSDDLIDDYEFIRQVRTDTCDVKSLKSLLTLTNDAVCSVQNLRSRCISRSFLML